MEHVTLVKDQKRIVVLGNHAVDLNRRSVATHMDAGSLLRQYVGYNIQMLDLDWSAPKVDPLRLVCKSSVGYYYLDLKTGKVHEYYGDHPTESPPLINLVRNLNYRTVTPNKEIYIDDVPEDGVLVSNNTWVTRVVAKNRIREGGKVYLNDLLVTLEKHIHTSMVGNHTLVACNQIWTPSHVITFGDDIPTVTPRLGTPNKNNVTQIILWEESK